MPIVSAVGHEQDTPLCDLAADVRASTPTAAARLVVPDLAELRERLERRARPSHRGARRAAERHAQRLSAARDRLRRAPLLALERKRARLETIARAPRRAQPVATLERGYAIVRRGDDVVRSPEQVATGDPRSRARRRGTFGAKVE